MNAVLVPPQPKIYHIAHVDRLPSIVADGFLWCDAEVVRRAPAGTTIGMSCASAAIPACTSATVCRSTSARAL
jgi:hypothetical protein